MEPIRKQQIISKAREKFADKIASLEFIRNNNNSQSTAKGEDGKCIFYPHNMLKAKELYFRPRESTMIISERIKKQSNLQSENILWGFKYKGDEHIGYILETLRETEALMLKSGKPSKNKTVENFYMVVASYNFYTGNVEVNVLDESYETSLEQLGYAESPEKFLETYNRYKRETEAERRSKTMHITVGLWEDMLAKIDKLSGRIDDLEKDISENYERRYNSMEE